MPPETTPTLATSAPSHRRSILILALILVVLALIGGVWYAYHSYMNNRAALERAKMVQILDAVPENPATESLTVEDKVRIMDKQHVEQEEAAEAAL